MRTVPGTPTSPTRAARRTGVVALLAALCACDAPETTWRQLTPSQWARRLWSKDPKEVEESHRQLVAFSRKAPALVVDAVARELSREAPAATSTVFALGVDRERSRRLGFPDVATAESARLDLPVLRARADALGLVVAFWRTTVEGQIDVALSGGGPRAVIERVQTVLATRGALEVRAVLEDPAGATDPARPAGKAYRGEVPYAERLAGEAARFAKAAATGTPYVPADPRIVAVPRPGTAEPSSPEDFLLVEEPPAGEEGFGDRMIAGASLDRSLDGRPFVVARVKPERVADARRALAGAGGAAVAVVIDGLAKAVIPSPVVSGDRVALPLWRGSGRAADEEARDLEVVLSAGRLERPLFPLPLGPDVGVGPPAENPFSKTLLEIGDPAAATLERLASGAPHEWTRRSAAWARDRLR